MDDQQPGELDHAESTAQESADSEFTAIATVLAAGIPDDLKGDANEHIASVYGCAVVHALRDFRQISGMGRFDEEPRTASLIGHLGSNLCWCALVGAIAGVEDDAPSVSWGYQSKIDEAERGGDFGLAVRLPDGNYNIAFFQAKNADEKGRLNMWRPPSPKTGRPKKTGDPAFDNAQAAIADMEAKDEARKAEDLLESVLDGQADLPENGHGQHQLVKLAVWSSKAQKADPKQRGFGDWIHYVMWPLEATPAQAFRLDALLDHLSTTSGTLSARMLVKPASVRDTSSFSALLLRGATAQAPGWLCADLAEATALIGDMTELCSQWLIVEGRSGGGLVSALDAAGITFKQTNPAAAQAASKAAAKATTKATTHATNSSKTKRDPKV